MSEYRLVIPQRAVPKGRPRVTTNGTYTPERTKAWEAKVGWEFVELHGKPLIEGEVLMALTFSGARAAQDVDNLAKGVLDALNGIAYADDRQVTRLVADKIVGGKPETRIMVMAREVAG
jgi:crossover junction endodeoxyribonuclease RusA